MTQTVLRPRKPEKTRVRLPRVVKRTLTNFQDRAINLFPDAISRIVLYGSYARGQFNSYSELMGLPKELLSTEYWFPWYNNAVPSLLDEQFRFGVP